MGPITVNAVRYGIPAVLFIAGMVVWATGGIAAGALFISAATAVLLLNVLFRIGFEATRPATARRTRGATSTSTGAGRASSYSPSCFPKISFITSSVPPPIGPRRVSRTARSISYSFM